MRPLTRRAGAAAAAFLLAGLGLAGAAAASPAAADPSAPSAGAPGTAGTDCGVLDINQVEPAAQNQPGATPVLFVHGMGSSPATWTADGHALPYQVAALGDTSVWAFDYSSAALDWVTDPRIGPALGASIACLAREFGQKVIVVAHSMGGLATQDAVSLPDGAGGTDADHVQEVITLGTPFRGSAFLTAMQNGTSGLEGILAAIPSPYTKATAAGIEAALGLCAADAAADNSNAWCGPLASLGRSPAGSGLEYDSAEIAALPAWPSTLPVLPMAGDITDTLGVGSASVTADLGDVPVTLDSATAHDSAGVAPVVIHCRLANGIQAIASSPCMHTQLMNDPVIRDDVVRVIDGLVHRKPATDIAGTWYGSYTCGQGLTGMTLTVADGAGTAISATWEFYPLAVNPGVASGSITMTGTDSTAGVGLTFQRWLQQPAGYTASNLTGALHDDGATLSGQVVNPAPGCTTFTLTRVPPVRADSGLAGVWDAGHGTFVEFDATGPGAYTGTVVRDAGYTCTPLNAAMQGSGDTYTGPIAYYQGPLPSCGAFVGNGTLTLTLSTDGSTASVGWTSPPGMGCSNCDVRTWRRVGSPGAAGSPTSASPTSGSPTAGLPSGPTP
jgi:pimeloyl-ACP methyl ester carboxylesterase